MRTPHLLMGASLLALALLPAQPAAASHGPESCRVDADAGIWSCTFVCHAGDVVSVHAYATGSYLEPRAIATCGGVGALCAGTLVCAGAAGPVGATGTGTCFLRSITTAGSCTSGLPLAGADVPACLDPRDEDGDGGAAYPQDPECAGPLDDGEGAGCDELAPDAYACLAPGQEWFRLEAREAGAVPGAAHDAAGHVDIYRFDLPGGVSVSLPCVTLVVDGAESPSCAEAGGVFVDRLATLVETTVTEPGVEEGAVVARVAACGADLRLTVDGLGVNSAPFLTLC